ncbi:hypothetical protein [Hyphomicrobium sp. ghe19]|uniref:hypothetical protein n=1 Tax=Hyphomicrobium sp. ghe19 TaxID=2682968 RepID=UPI0013676477|nr:hypothetical protein HYPP_04381 [Hyphomicrobium sp. ghe19]
MAKKNLRTTKIVASDNQELILVSLNKQEDKIASLWKSDYDALINDIKLSPNWLTPPGKDHVLASSITGSKVGVARVLLDAQPGMKVRYKDGNPLNLCRPNLVLMDNHKNGGKRRDRDFIRSSMSIEERPDGAA